MILITGATGLLGGHTLYALLQKHDRVAALKRPTARTDTLMEIFSYYTGEPERLFERIEWRTGDLLDKGSLLEAMNGIDMVINCAAIVSFDPRERKRLIRNNVEGAGNLVHAMLEQKRESDISIADSYVPCLVHVSSTSALGDGPGENPDFFIDEDTPRKGNRRHTGYSESKYESERVILESGVPAVVLNPGIILGPGQWDKGSSQLFIRARHGFTYYPYGGTGYVDVRDVASVICAVADRFFTAAPPEGQFSGSEYGQSMIGERYCLVGANLRYREFFNLVTDEFGIRNPSVYAGRFLTGIAWRAETFRARLSGRSPVLTRETAEAARRISFYSSEKIRKALAIEFRAVEDTVQWVADCLKKFERK